MTKAASDLGGFTTQDQQIVIRVSRDTLDSFGR
jgi:hypothetical protein